jgi:hypoxanthine phosphoribosyltransferase
MTSPSIQSLYSSADLSARVGELGAAITEAYRGKELVLVGVLKGAFVFLADLVRAIDLPLSVDFLSVSSYGPGTKSSGVVRLVEDLSAPIEDKHVILVEDIVDTGLTARYLLENLQTRKPASLALCSLLEKPARSQVEVPIEYRGFVIDDVFVVGYGLDHDQRYRNLPFIGVVQP